MKKLQNLENKIGLTGCNWSSLNAPGTETLFFAFPNPYVPFLLQNVFRNKRSANPDDVLGSFSSFYSSKRDVPSSFSSFYGGSGGKRSAAAPETFSSFYGKRSDNVPGTFRSDPILQRRFSAQIAVRVFKT